MSVAPLARRPLPLSFREAGAGPTLVFVHGLGVSSRYFAPLMRELQGSFHCIAPDLPGCGASRGPWRALDIGGLADALSRFLDERGLLDVTFVANSLGCQVVAALAQREPARASALVLIAPTLDPATRHHFWRSLALACYREPLSLLPILLRDYLRFGLRRFLATCRHALADDLGARIRHLRQPVLVIQGSRDRIVTVPWATHVALSLRRGQLALVPDAAHAVHFSRPALVAGLIRAFLQDAERT